MAGSRLNRGYGYQPRSWDLLQPLVKRVELDGVTFGEREYLLAPLNAAGQPVDFSFKEGKFGDFENHKAALNSQQDQLARIAAVDAQFLGYSRDSRNKLAAPVFRYRVGKNTLETSASIAANGDLVLGIPRGGVIVAEPVARALRAPLDVVVPRKLGAPDNPELAIGAVALADGEEITVVDEESLAWLRVPRTYVAEEAKRQRREMQRRRAA